MFFDTGDYVILEDNSSWSRNYGVIVKVLKYSFYAQVLFPSSEGINNLIQDGDRYYAWVMKKMVLRHMTDQEKKDLEILLDADKYNI